MDLPRASVHHSASTWRQPTPPLASAERSAVVEAVARRILACGQKRRLLVGIDGFTAAGKTSLGHELAELITAVGRPVLRATLDDFKNPWKDRHLYDRESGEGYYRNAYDYAAKRLLLDPCRSPAASSAVLCRIDPLTQQDHSSDATPLASDAVLIVDGVFAFRPEINAYWDFRIWLHVDAELSVRRGADRDQDWAGSEAESIHRNRYLVAERIYLEEVVVLLVEPDTTCRSGPRTPHFAGGRCL